MMRRFVLFTLLMIFPTSGIAGVSANDLLPPDLLRALPHASDGKLFVEAILCVRDLKDFSDFIDRQFEILQETEEGRALIRSGDGKRGSVLELSRDLDALIEVMSPKELRPASVTIVGWTHDGIPGAQALVQTDAGVMGRIETFAGGRDDWRTIRDGDILRIQIDELTLVAQFDSTGWLRVAPDESMLIGGGGDPVLVDSSVSARLASCHGMLVIRRGGELGEIIERHMAHPGLELLVSTWRTLAIGWTLHSDGSKAVTLLVDAEVFERVRSLVRSDSVLNRFVGLWDADAAGLLSLSVPPLVMRGVLPTALGVLAALSVPAPPDFIQASAQLQGRVGAVSFGAPGDWALGLDFNHAEAARKWVRASYKWLAAIQRSRGGDPEKLLEIEGDESRGDVVMHVRPDELLQGVRVASYDDVVVIAGQRARLESFAMKGGATTAGHGRPGSFLKGPLTPMIKSSLETPSLLLGYMVLGGDGAFLESLGWLVGFADLLPDFDGDGRLKGELGNTVARWPGVMTMFGFLYAMSYDMAVTADLDRSVLVMQFASSEI